MQPLRQLLPALSFAAALGAPMLAVAGDVPGSTPSPGTYYFVGRCTTGCTGQATATWVVGSPMTFQLMSSAGPVNFGQQVIGGSVQNPPSGFSRVGVFDTIKQDSVISFISSFSSLDDGVWRLNWTTLSLSGTDGTWSTTPIPEPATYAMALMGLGALAVAARRRKSRQPGA